jgi:hypothetical protein
MTNKIVNVQTLLWIALALALLGSLKHLAVVFSSVDGSTLMGWIQAIAIDAGVFALSMVLQKRRQAARPTAWVIGGIALFTLISVYGNLVYGLSHQSQLSPNLPTWAAMPLPYLLAATLPVLVLFLASLVENDLTYEAKIADREAKRQARIDRQNSQINPDSVDTLTLARQVKKDNIDHRRQEILTLKGQDLTHQEIADRLEVSLSTVKNDLRQLNGQVQNG